MPHTKRSVLLAVLTLALSACTSAAGPGSSEGATAPSAASVQSSAPAQGGKAAGVVRYSDGRPLAGATIIARGKEFAAEVTAKTGADGKYSMDIGQKDANWRLDAWYEPEYPSGTGQKYKFPLVVVGDADTSFLGSKGIARDFVWKLSGPAPWGANRQPSESSYYIGTYIDVYVYDPITDSGAQKALATPAGTTIELTLTPTDKLIDGSSAATAIRKLTPKSSKPGISSAGTIMDVPIGRYTVTGKLVSADGAKQLILGVTCVGAVQGVCPLRPAALTTSAPMEFPPQTGQIRPYQSQPGTYAQMYLQLAP